MGVLLLLSLGCPVTPDSAPDRRHGRDSGAVDTADTANDTGETGDSAPDECDSLAAIPVKSSYLPGFTGAEDFAFDAEGYLVSIDQNGNMVRINQAGDQQVVVVAASTSGAGTRFLPDGDIVFCDVPNGALVRADPNTGGSVTVLSGLEYPNGLDVGLDGFVYVSEQAAGRVRRVNPDTGEYTIILEGLYNPNGVTFAPGYQSIFVGSFGAGVVWTSDRIDDTTWTDPRIYATSPEAPGVPPNWCDSHGAGEICPLSTGYGIGVCGDEGAGPTCVENPDTAACEGAALGEACTTTFFDETVEQTCQFEDGAKFCPTVGAEQENACSGLTVGNVCTTSAGTGQCLATYEGVLACWVDTAYYAALAAGCEGKATGDECQVRDSVYPTLGACTDGSAWGFASDLCLPPGSGGTRGGLDAINMDSCGNLYVSEYIEGEIWRFPSEGAPAEEAAKLRSQWIPNMHWGNGRGGWDETTLYVMDRNRKGVFALPLDVTGHGDAYVPPEI